MNIRKLLVSICIMLYSILFLVGCKSNNISLDFLITPERLKLYSNSQLTSLNEIEDRARLFIKWRNEKYDDLTKMSEEDIKIGEDIHNEVMDILDSGKIIENKSTIENIFNQLRDLEGVYVDSFEEKVITRIDLIEDPETESVVSLDNAYLRNFILLEDGNMVIPKGIMSKSTNRLEPTGKIEYIKVKLTDKLKHQLQELVQD